MASCAGPGESWVFLGSFTCGNPTGIWGAFGKIRWRHGWVWLSLFQGMRERIEPSVRRFWVLVFDIQISELHSPLCWKSVYPVVKRVG